MQNCCRCAYSSMAGWERAVPEGEPEAGALVSLGDRSRRYVTGKVFGFIFNRASW